jgi:O-antigen biosynthesis protein
MADEHSIFDEPHHQSLELLAAQALAEGNFAVAFKLADRRCRILPTPEPHCYLLRGEASYYLGANTAAIADIVKALELAPDDVGANRRMLAWAHGTQQLRAALAIIRNDRNLKFLQAAAQTLQKNGQRTFANMTILEDAIEGWAVWEREGPLEVSITDGGAEVGGKFDADAFHPLGEFGRATSFRVRRPKSTKPQMILLAIAGKVFHSTRAAGNDISQKTRVLRSRARNSPAQQVTVVVPIYEDYDATRVCIEALLHELRADNHRAILVDDATPDPRIAGYLAELAADSRVELITNALNLGFIGSVNRALEHVKRGDIIILNSDTIVPHGFINRLAAAARLSLNIGTVTPLSNNGEFVSFPIPNKANPLGSRYEIERIDAIAAKANSHQIIDIPSGIGFCLYITRACLDRVGPLSEDFSRGYLEDVDFCLRARRHEFRNVCAPSVYVGHAGSKSFGQEKRSLVVRNLRVLERRFPNHRSECAAFLEADPLKTARQAIERTAAAVACNPRLFVTGAGVVGAIARQRARSVASTEAPAIILEVQHGANGAIVRLINAAGEMPQALQFNLSASSERAMLVDFMKGNEPSRIEILDPANTPFQLIDLLLNLKVPYDIFIADGGLLGRYNGQILATAVRCLATQESDKSCDGSCGAAEETGNWTDRWQRITEGAQRIVVPCARAEAFAASFLPQHTVDRIDRSYERRHSAKRKRRKGAVCHLGFVLVRSCAHEQWLVSETARQLSRLRPDMLMTVIGAALDDIGLMRSSNAFVTGAVDPEEFEDLVDALGVGHLFVSAARPVFGHPTLSIAFSSCLPTAYFDWSAGQCVPIKQDLAIDPRSSFAELIGALDRWISYRAQGRGEDL